MTINWDDSKFKKIAKDEAMKRMIKSGFIVEGAAKRISPFDTGRLRASISTNWTGGMSAGKTTSKQDKGISAPTEPFRVVVGSNVEYAPDVELGNSKQSAQPYLRPALFGSLPMIRKIMGTK
jgi:HK97 gp10 family phage protein